jgi:uncharacterized membrane protein
MAIDSNEVRPPRFVDDVLVRLEHDSRLDIMIRVADPVAERLGSGVRGALLRGKWLGHALHPMLTDLPIGFWTSAFVLDVVGGRRSQPAAQKLIGIGLLSVVPTAAAGLVDWSDIDDTPRRRVGVAHAVSNSVAAALYTLSWISRRRGRHLAGVLLGVAAGTAATVGGHLGGHLVFGSSDPEAGD